MPAGALPAGDYARPSGRIGASTTSVCGSAFSQLKRRNIPLFTTSALSQPPSSIPRQLRSESSTWALVAGITSNPAVGRANLPGEFSEERWPRWSARNLPALSAGDADAMRLLLRGSSRLGPRKLL